MKTVAVTGGIGSGKSTVCAILSSMGVPVYDSDSRARALYDEQPALVSRILDEFAALGVHDSLWDECGELDRKKLAGLVFSSPRLLSALEGIVHPAVREDFLSWKESIGEKEWTGPGDVPFVVIESAIITEKPLFRDIVDKVVEVRASRRWKRRSRSVEYSLKVSLTSSEVWAKSITMLAGYSSSAKRSTSVVFPTRRAPSTSSAVSPALARFQSSSLPYAFRSYICVPPAITINELNMP